MKSERRHDGARRSPGNRPSRKSSGITSPKPGADGNLKEVFATIGVPESTPFTPDRYQLEALSAIKSGDCLVTAPTGAGKTWIAETAIQQTLDQGGRSWYASPLKALSNSKYIDFCELFGESRAGILTGDRKENPEGSVIVGTTEILRNQLYDAMHHGEDLDADFVIIDEAHFLGDEDRGVVWEEIMIYLPERIPMLLLSATIGNAKQIADWLSSIRSRPCTVVEERERPVPLYPLFLHPSGTLYPLLARSKSKKKRRLHKKVESYLRQKAPPLMAPPRRLPPMGTILSILGKYDLLPAIVFLKSRADCDAAVEMCTGRPIRDDGRKAMLQNRLESLSSKLPHMLGHRQLWHLEHLAVGAHHSGQLPSWKLVVETLMTEGLLDAVFATSTVAAGVNFPARTIVFLNSDRFNGVEFLPLNPTELHQMTGRAGRRGMDNIGFAILIPGKFMDVQLVAKLFDSPPADVNSQIKINFSMTLNILLSHSPAGVYDLLKKSFANYLLTKGKKKRKTTSEDSERLWREFTRYLDFLKETGYVRKDGRLTDNGVWTSQLRVDEPLLIAEGFRKGVFPDHDPVLMAAIVAAFVNEREVDDRMDKKIVPQRLIKALNKVKSGLRDFVKLMIDRGFGPRPLYLRPALTIYLWASDSISWEENLSVADMAEGDLAMLILRTADNLRHIQSLWDVFPEAAESAREAISLILREPVTGVYVA